MIGHSLKNMFDSLGFAYDFAFCQNNGSLKIFQNVFWKKSFKHGKRYQVFWGAKHIKRNGVQWVQICEIVEVPES